MTHPFELVLTPPATRAIQTRLPESVAAAVVEFLTGALIDSPHRVGKPLRGELAGIHSARRGTYRVLYRINEQAHEVVVLRIEHHRRLRAPLTRGGYCGGSLATLVGVIYGAVDRPPFTGTSANCSLARG